MFCEKVDWYNCLCLFQLISVVAVIVCVVEIIHFCMGLKRGESKVTPAVLHAPVMRCFSLVSKHILVTFHKQIQIFCFSFALVTSSYRLMLKWGHNMKTRDAVQRCLSFIPFAANQDGLHIHFFLFSSDDHYDNDHGFKNYDFISCFKLLASEPAMQKMNLAHSCGYVVISKTSFPAHPPKDKYCCWKVFGLNRHCCKVVNAQKIWS